MGRTRAFVETEVLTAAAGVFVRGGYEATSVDDLVTALGVHRGSLYNTFGSKRGLFVRALRQHVGALLAGLPDDRDAVRELLVDGPALDLVVVAAVERGADDPEVADLVRTVLDRLDTFADPHRPGGGAALLGARIRARLLTAPPDHPPTREAP